MAEIRDQRYMLEHVQHLFEATGADGLLELHVAINLPLYDPKIREIESALSSIAPGKYDRVLFQWQPKGE